LSIRRYTDRRLQVGPEKATDRVDDRRALINV